MNEVFTVAEAAARLKADPSTLRRLLRDGRLGGFRLGSDWRIPQTDLDTYIERNRNAQNPIIEAAWNAAARHTGQPDDDDEDAYWAAEATAVLDRLERGEEQVITLEQWEARHGLGG